MSTDPIRADARERIREALAEHTPALTALPENGVITRFVVVMEYALVDDRKAFQQISGNATGGEVSSWDQSGLLMKAAVRELLHGTLP